MKKTASFVLLPLLVASALFMANCASIIHGSKQMITFQSTPVGATVSVADAMGVGYGECVTPCEIELKRKREYHVKFMKEGYSAADLVIQRKSSGWIWGNILLGGVIGLVIDFSNGSAYKLSPEQMQATLSKETLGRFPKKDESITLLFIDFDQLAKEEKEKLKSVEPIDWPIGILTI